MAFPTSPTNGQITVVNNVSYQYSNVSNSWTRILSTANIITANTIVSNGYISAAGNVSGNYIFGNGSQLTGITLNPGNISNGTSNVTVVSSGGNVTVGVGGTGNVAVFATTGEYVTGIISASGNIISAGNVTGGNLLTGGAISATGTLSVTGATTLGTASTGNLSAGNVTTGGLVSAAGNVTGGNILTAGLVSAAGTITGSSHLGSVISASGNVTGGNILTGGLISATGTVTGSSHLGAVVSVTANVTGGNLLTGGLASVTGNIQGGNLRTVGQISATGNITGNFYIGNGAFLTGLNAGATSQIANGATTISIPVASGNIAMNVAGASNTVVINLGSLTMYGTFAGPKTLTANVAVADSVNALLLGPVTIDDGYHIDVPSNSTLSTYGDESPNIVGATLTVSGNITGGNVLSNGLISTAGNILTTGLISATANILTSGLISATGNITGGNIQTVGQISATGNILTSGLISATGNITGNNIFTSGDILPTANATANIGGLSFQYNTIFAKATSAQYADLAENYEADANYEPGTVVCFGGAKEVTVCNLADCISVAGVVSTNPSYLMNSGQIGEYVVAVALQGRVPTKVTGQIRKGDLIVSAGDGRGRANNDARAGTIIGKALVNSEGDAVIEVVVGRN